jgi:serine/threonine protein kinase
MSSAEPRYSAKADVYSFAMTCYEILTGKPPFHNLPRMSIDEMAMKGKRPELPIHMDKTLSSLIQRCWHTDAGKRPTFADICSSMRKIMVSYNPSFHPSSSSNPLLRPSSSLCTIS